MKGYISQIETMGLLDGPGVRTVIFLDGCPLRCAYCHNPEMWKINKESKTYTPEELMELINKYKSYYGKNGGVTFSGGEPLFQTSFLKNIVKLCKENNINATLDTSGSIFNKEVEEIIEMVDLIILDIKAIDFENYKKITGYEMDIFNKFLEFIKTKNKSLWIRTVIIPEINDNEEAIKSLANYIKEIPNVKKIELLPYHKMGDIKYKNLNIKNTLENTKAMDIDKCKILENKLKELLNS